MDARAFDRLARSLSIAGTRRIALGALLVATSFGLGRGQRVGAQPTCLDPGQRCQTGEECCSGRCRRRNDGKKVCRPAGNQGICTTAQNFCTNGPTQCGTTNNGGACYCLVTTRGRSFCVAWEENLGNHCDCTSNKECERRTGKGAKCVDLTGTGCNFCRFSTHACMSPCPNLDSIP